MKKLLVVGVIFLFLGLACAPSINATIYRRTKDNELIDCIDIFGGIGIKIRIGNPYHVDMYNLSWTIRIKGIGFLSQVNFSGKIDYLGPNDKYPLWKLVFGIYYGEIRVDLRASEGENFFESTIMIVFGPLVHVRNNY